MVSTRYQRDIVLISQQFQFDIINAAIADGIHADGTLKALPAGGHRMDPTADDLAGVVDLFGALTREELRRALSELAFKRGEEVDDADARIDDALASYHLIGVDDADRTLLVPGPTAFPALPEGADDLPHIMEDAGHAVDEADRMAAVETRFREDAAEAIDDGDAERIAELLDVSYELEVWGDVDLETARDRLDSASE